MRISENQALDCLKSDDLIGIGMEADAIRRELHPEQVVTYTLSQDGNDTTAVLLFGKGETVEDRIAELAAIREKAERGEISALRLIASRDLAPEDPTAVEYLKTLAVARLFLDNVPHIEASLDTQGLKVLQMALRFGADDAGVIDAGEEENVRRVIRGAGFQPVERDVAYRMAFVG